MRTLVFTAALLTALTACGPRHDVLSEADLAAIAQLRTDFVEVTLARDFDGVLASRAEDAVWMPPNAPLLVGKAKIRAFLEAGPTPTAFVLTPGRTEGGDVAYERGRYAYSTVIGADTVSESGKYLVILRRQADNSWRIAVDIWNTDAPAPIPTTASGP